MPEPDIAALRREVVGRYRTVHAFCRANRHLNRSTVYMVLAGRYPGNLERQAGRILATLDGTTREAELFEAIKRAACERCDVSVPCGRCDGLFQAQTRAAMDLFSAWVT